MLLLVDYREKWFLQKITETKTEIQYKATNLKVGDFIFVDTHTETVGGGAGNHAAQTTTDAPETTTEANTHTQTHVASTDTSNNTCTPNNVLVIERKSIRDLCASITDGRFRQQKARLTESVGDHDKIMYIIEGGRKKCHSTSLSQTIINSSILNILFKHKFKVLFTDNETDTFNNLLLLYKKLKNGDFKASVEPVAPTKLVSKGTSIKDNLFALQLSVIPGVSFATAQTIAKEYTTMKNLIDAFQNTDSSDSSSMLSEIKLSERRKVGIALSKKIYTALLS
uniref:ERCC4 domain-containing protein n=1 Tax=viral metagenome TaxID=1070528 RepID=A0A6C0H6Y0_9ZZZZ